MPEAGGRRSSYSSSCASECYALRQGWPKQFEILFIPTAIVSLPNSSGSWRDYIEYNQASEQPCSQNSNKSLQTHYTS